MKITIHEEKNSHFTFHGEKTGPITSHENTLYHPQFSSSCALSKLFASRLSIFSRQMEAFNYLHEIEIFLYKFSFFWYGVVNGILLIWKCPYFLLSKLTMNSSFLVIRDFVSSNGLWFSKMVFTEIGIPYPSGTLFPLKWQINRVWRHLGPVASVFSFQQLFTHIYCMYLFSFISVVIGWSLW